MDILRMLHEEHVMLTFVMELDQLPTASPATCPKCGKVAEVFRRTADGLVCVACERRGI